MILYLTIIGMFFIIGSSIVLNYIYSIFPINKITNFLNPTEDTIFNNISISFIPILIWALIELPLLGNNYYFILGLILNIFITLAVSYIIKYGYTLISNKENNIVDIIAIFTSVFFGSTINYICLLIVKTTEMKISIIGTLLIIAFYIFIKVFPPNSEFFKGKQKK